MRKGFSGEVGHVASAVTGQGGTKHALLAERIRIKHIRKALACTTDGLFRARCEAELASSMARALHLERTILAAADAPGYGHGQADALQLGECLLSAMDMARANGDASAAEAVAQECLALVEVHCRSLLDIQSLEPVGGLREQTSFSNGAVES